MNATMPKLNQLFYLATDALFYGKLLNYGAKNVNQLSATVDFLLTAVL